MSRRYRRNPALGDAVDLATLALIGVGAYLAYEFFTKGSSAGNIPGGSSPTNPLGITNPSLYQYDPIGWAEQMLSGTQQLTPQDAMQLQQLGMGSVPGETDLGGGTPNDFPQNNSNLYQGTIGQ